MISYIDADILTSKADAWVCPVNCVGKMGRGLPMRLRDHLPYKYFTEFQRDCDGGRTRISTVNTFFHGGTPRWVINLPVLYHYNDPGSIEYVTRGLRDLRTFVRNSSIHSIAMSEDLATYPRLPWDLVEDAILEEFEGEAIAIELYVPTEGTEDGGANDEGVGGGDATVAPAAEGWPACCD
jgi:O-acetyl-ADP-ribose deacetylase (regulator of RNase III)